MSKGIPGNRPYVVSPRFPWMRFRTPTSGGSRPPRRSTFHSPSSSGTASVLPAVPPKNLPFPPMEAELVDELPTGEWQYEPKWDGFRGVLENIGGDLRLWSRNGRPLLRYFPELSEGGALLPPDSALGGEIGIPQKGQV